MSPRKIPTPAEFVSHDGFTAAEFVPREVFHVRIEEIQKDIKEAKSIALSAKKIADKPTCVKEEVLNSLKSEVTGWAKWWRGIIVTIILCVFIMAGWFFSDQAQSDKIEQLDSTILEVKQDVKDISHSQENLAMKFDAQVRLNTERQKRQSAELRETFKSVLEEHEVERDTGRRDRRRGSASRQ
jgi:archaellum component FlaC